jgi:hypothetical protein
MTVAEREFDSLSNASGAGISESVGGVVAIVLTILGLAHVAPELLVAIALIAAGAALVLRGVVLVGEYGRALRRSGAASAFAELGGGGALSVELLAGGAGIILGILALLRVDPVDLVAIGVIALGGALVLSTNATARLTGFKVAAAYSDERTQRLAGEIMAGSASVQAVAGLAAIVLGILALAGFAPIVLLLIALLALGSFIVLNGGSASDAILTMFRHA